MDNLGDWLYIVFLAIAVISGLFSSGKKKNRQAAKPVQPGEQDNTPQNTTQGKGFWELLEEMQGGTQEEKKPQKRFSPSPKTVTPQKSKVHSPFLTAESSIPGLQTQRQEPILFEDVHNAPHTISSEDFHLQNVEEVRKAIIYSEILNRRYQ